VQWKPKKRDPHDDLRLKVLEWLSDVTDNRSTQVFCEDNYVAQEDLVPILGDKDFVTRVQEASSKKKEVTRMLLMKRAFAKAATGNVQATKLYEELSGTAMKESTNWHETKGYKELEKLSMKELDDEIMRRLGELKKSGEGKFWKKARTMLGKRRQRAQRRAVFQETS
jgi:hypothetical protein